MGLFDRKYCDICGEKIGLLGNRRLEDGNLCKNCARKLSPWFSDRRNSTVSEIREQLEWREANHERTAQFCTTRSFGERTKLLLDENHQWFTITRSTRLAEDNPDVLDFSVITGCRMDIDESRTELKMETKDKEGKIVRKSYSPPRYEYDYDFHIVVSVNLPFFNEMKFQLNDSSVHIPFRSTGITWIGGGFVQSPQGEPLDNQFYRRYKEACEEICNLLERIRSHAVTGQPAEENFRDGEGCAQAAAVSPAADSHIAQVREENAVESWTCPSCGAVNRGKFCAYCGTERN